MRLTKITVLLAVGVVALIGGMPMPVPETDDMTMEEIETYFKSYGYMGASMPDPEIADLVETDMGKAFDMAIKIFQMRYGLRQTGRLDATTMAMLSMPRCGLRDILTMEDTGMGMRKRRYVLAREKWEKQDLTYNVSQYPRDKDLSEAEVDDAMARAFQVWADVTPLRFYKLPSGSREVPDIDIQFSISYPFYHGDDYRFDGEGGTLAHAFYPQSGQIGGDAHFDEAERWTIYTHDGINLFQVAAHEFGHALGLAHSRDPNALMAPFYAGYKPDFVLPTDDVMGIQALYGTKEDREEPVTQPPVTHQPPTMKPEGRDLCRESTFDAITTLEDDQGKNMYGFRGDFYFLINEDQGIAHGYPRSISGDFPGVPRDLDAALFWDKGWRWNDRDSKWEWKNKGSTFFFKGSNVWEVEDKRVIRGPEAISSRWSGLPDNIDAAFVFRANGHLYFIKGDQYYRSTHGVRIDPNYPRPLSVWNGLPSSIDAALQTPSGKTVFFSGNQYYLYDDYSFDVQAGYPRHSFYEWFNCWFGETKQRSHNRHHHGNHRNQRIPDLRNIGQ